MKYFLRLLVAVGLLCTNVYGEVNKQQELIQKLCPGLLDKKTKYDSVGIQDSYLTCKSILAAKAEMLGTSQKINEIERALRKNSSTGLGTTLSDESNPLTESDELFVVGLSGFESDRIARVLYKGVMRRVQNGAVIGPYTIKGIEDGYLVAAKGRTNQQLYTMSYDEVKQHLGITDEKKPAQHGVPVLTPQGLGKLF